MSTYHTSPLPLRFLSRILIPEPNSVFVLESPTLPAPLISLIRLLLSQNGEWEKARDKGKLPKGKIGDEDGVIVDVGERVLWRRLGEYPTSLEVSL